MNLFARKNSDTHLSKWPCRRAAGARCWGRGGNKTWSSDFVVNACRPTSPGIWGQNAIGSECFRERIGRENDPLVDELTEMSGSGSCRRAPVPQAGPSATGSRGAPEGHDRQVTTVRVEGDGSLEPLSGLARDERQGLAHGEPRGQRERGSMRGLRLAGKRRP